MLAETMIASFIVRFVKPAEVPGGNKTRLSAGWRIVVRHVQSGYERRFTEMDDAVEFIRDEIDMLEQA